MTNCRQLSNTLWQLFELWPQAVADMGKQVCWDAFDGMYAIPKTVDFCLPMGGE